MTVIEIILPIIFASAILSGHISVASLKEFTLDEYVGVWYTIGLTHIKPIDNNMTCIWSNVTRLGDDNESFREVQKMKIIHSTRVILDETQGVGKVVDSEVHIRYLEGMKSNSMRIFTMTPYNNGEQYIAQVKGDQHDNILISRSPNAPVYVMEEFKKLAHSLGERVSYFSHENCNYI